MMAGGKSKGKHGKGSKDRQTGMGQAAHSKLTCMQARTLRDRDWACRHCALPIFGQKLKCHGCGVDESQAEEWDLSRVRPDYNAGKALA